MIECNEEQFPHATVADLPATFHVMKTKADEAAARIVGELDKSLVDSTGQSRMIICDVFH